MDFSNTDRDTTFNLANIALNLSITWGCIRYGLAGLADVLLPITFFALAFMNKVSFSNGIFFNKEGNDLTQKLPKKFSAWITLSVMVTAVGMFINVVPVGGGLIASFITVLSFYFMFNQCPISIINSNDAWKYKKAVFGMVPSPQAKMEPAKYNTFKDSPAFRNRLGSKWYRSRY